MVESNVGMLLKLAKHFLFDNRFEISEYYFHSERD